MLALLPETVTPDRLTEPGPELLRDAVVDERIDARVTVHHAVP